MLESQMHPTTAFGTQLAVAMVSCLKSPFGTAALVKVLVLAWPSKSALLWRLALAIRPTKASESRTAKQCVLAMTYD
jgi:hypothetical protein